MPSLPSRPVVVTTCSWAPPSGSASLSPCAIILTEFRTLAANKGPADQHISEAKTEQINRRSPRAPAAAAAVDEWIQDIPRRRVARLVADCGISHGPDHKHRSAPLPRPQHARQSPWTRRMELRLTTQVLSPSKNRGVKSFVEAPA